MPYALPGRSSLVRELAWAQRSFSLLLVTFLMIDDHKITTRVTNPAGGKCSNIFGGGVYESEAASDRRVEFVPLSVRSAAASHARSVEMFQDRFLSV